MISCRSDRLPTVTADLATLEALARLVLRARRCGITVHIHSDDAGLCAFAEFIGLAGVVEFRDGDPREPPSEV
jgi:hypothetical protein